MAAFDFPSSPSNGDNYTANGVTWSWDGSAWRRSGGVGAQGAAGAQGAEGHQGATGATGAQGATGSTGAQGNNGSNGSTGAQGATGSTGAQGATGATGAQGNNGSNGSNGAQGAAGTDASLPSGVIVIWSGSTGSIPSGWVLCNGSNSTPDLRDRFVVGAGSGYSVGNTGGSSSVTLSTSQIPAHNHGISDPGHDHDTTVDGHHLFDGNGSQSIGYGGPGGYPAQEFELYNATTGISIQNAGGGGSHENRPPYYALAYIMKT